MSRAPDYAPPGLPIGQLLKLKAQGHISLQQFLEMTAELEGMNEDRPICFDGTTAPAVADAAHAAAADSSSSAPAVPASVRDRAAA
eukprot:157123-Prymnesium_polylepis.1